MLSDSSPLIGFSSTACVLATDIELSAATLSQIMVFCDALSDPEGVSERAKRNLEKAEAREELDGLKSEAEQYPDSVPFPWLEAMLKQLGLEVYTHNFTLNYPLGERKSFTGQNVYAIMRAPRASSTESLVLSVPYRPPNSLEQGTDAAIAVLLSTAKFFRRQYYCKRFAHNMPYRIFCSSHF